MTPNAPWLLLQLVDGTFPSGGFAHSNGLEAGATLGGVDDVASFLDQVLGQATSCALPFVRAAAEAPDRLPAFDERCDATIPLAVQNRASRAQGRALAGAVARVFDHDQRILALAYHARETGPAHHAPVLGAVFGALDITPRDAMIAYLHGAVRNVLSAGVRLGMLGPLEAQKIQLQRAPLLERLLVRAEKMGLDDVAQTAPLVEIWGAKHDELDARLFQS
jgi:urease accessory protein